MTDDNKTTPGKTCFYQGEKHKQALFQIAPGISCQHAREQASELIGCVRDLTLNAVMDNDPQQIWAAYYLSALAKALMDDAELGMTG